MNIPAVDAIRLFEANPRALMLNDLNACAKALNELSKEFPSVDFIAVLEHEPHILSREV
ncbi:unnamed product [Ostreococcus tauri]|uniref:Unnamed product n=1 Tax=Ostreococcus tauri TaxID=70448 RepID=A0A090N430_OSTTA|nr:unnamed product [Ostreococcus tauri]CEF99153.1 unnamed product [Ostreococcus tauri]|eukprot:XP_003081326.2 unnamed product [Ostreococcus tauri]